MFLRPISHSTHLLSKVPTPPKRHSRQSYSLKMQQLQPFSRESEQYDHSIGQQKSIWLSTEATYSLTILKAKDVVRTILNLQKECASLRFQLDQIFLKENQRLENQQRQIFWQNRLAEVNQGTGLVLLAGELPTTVSEWALFDKACQQVQPERLTVVGLSPDQGAKDLPILLRSIPSVTHLTLMGEGTNQLTDCHLGPILLTLSMPQSVALKSKLRYLSLPDNNFSSEGKARLINAVANLGTSKTMLDLAGADTNPYLNTLLLNVRPLLKMTGSLVRA